MTADLANEYIKRRMVELGHNDNYYIRFRHFVLGPMEKRKIDYGLQLFVLTEPTENIRIQSEMGIFDLLEIATNELQYEHQGTIQLTNYSAIPQHLKMIQVIFKHQ